MKWMKPQNGEIVQSEIPNCFTPLRSTQLLYRKMTSKSYREAFVASRISQTIATQVRVLRQQNGMSQQELAKALNTSQNAVSRLENPKYGKASLSTLKAVASFFDVALVVRFSAYSELAKWTATLVPASMNVASFEKDDGFVQAKPQFAGFAGYVKFQSQTPEWDQESVGLTSDNTTIQVVPTVIWSATAQMGPKESFKQ